MSLSDFIDSLISASDIIDHLKAVDTASDVIDTLDNVDTASDVIDTLDAVDAASDVIDTLDNVDAISNAADTVDAVDAMDYISQVNYCDSSAYYEPSIAPDGYNPSFMQNPPASDIDGYVPNGKITLSSINDNKHTFKCYKKNNSLFVYEDGCWKKVSGNGVVNIGNIMFKKK